MGKWPKIRIDLIRTEEKEEKIKKTINKIQFRYCFPLQPFRKHEFVNLYLNSNFLFFCEGDGPGVGKGRTISGMVLENYILKRKKILWVSVSSDLKIDSERDLRDIGADKIKVYALNKVSFRICVWCLNFLRMYFVNSLLLCFKSIRNLYR